MERNKVGLESILEEREIGMGIEPRRRTNANNNRPNI